ncbi:Ribonuclease T2 precursor (RNase T2) [Gnomoniopsis smithogilvyi]|uniref:Ribonuclease T2-like n=1 Tax=Gnomoniopsis smithogilvyi TaxID=1191159 RepID=A0A9W9CYG9_9PEZI|nr:Ribonuclease T2 precursor (RNase T2) [Gnomoniopsis smithogilvyi]
MLAVLAPLFALPLAHAKSGDAIFGRATCTGSIQSCSTASTTANSCCVNTPGGQFLQTQFWDTDPVTGPSNSWTIHGLWPDNCDGTYDEDCDSSRDYSSITNILNQFGKSDLLSYMEDYWQSNSESPEAFWEHEWSTHGTCVSTLEPACYTSYTTGQEAADYFQIVVDLFKTLDTYTILANAGITPSSSKTYTSAAIIAAIKAEFGFAPVISCSSSELYQIYYGFYAVGSLKDADFVPSTIVGQTSNCPSTGVKYLPKSGATAAPTTTGTATSTKTTTTAAATGTGVVSGTGYWNANYGGSVDGCLISAGTWYTTGTCATFTATASGSGFTLKTSKGSCGVVSGAISCASGVTASVFTTVNGLLAYNGATTFYTSVVPTGSTQATVYTASKSYSVTFSWSAV